jgi:hypothetical protein
MQTMKTQTMKVILKVISILLLIHLQYTTLTAQISINDDGAAPDASAMLEVTSKRKGLLIPRVTTAERTAISTPATGLLVYDTSGNVGVGGIAKNAQFEVTGLGSVFSSYTYGNLNSTEKVGTPTYSIYADGIITGTGFHAHSDERIKNILGLSNSRADLGTLMDIRITNYTLKDKISNGNKVTKKVIAQQVKDVYPQAVCRNTTQAIPNIYKKATIQNGWIKLNTDLKVGDRVQLMVQNTKETFDVLDVAEGEFQVFTMYQGDVFVYGKEVNDFHTVDYEAISMLNVSATQHLAREVETLKNENRKLKTKVARIDEQQQKINELQEQNTEIKAMLNQINAQLGNL